jgi:hypothetical protein
MLSKHYARIGMHTRQIFNSRNPENLSDEQIGLMVTQWVQSMEKEAERDARDRANGKGV